MGAPAWPGSRDGWVGPGVLSSSPISRIPVHTCLPNHPNFQLQGSEPRAEQNLQHTTVQSIGSDLKTSHVPHRSDTPLPISPRTGNFPPIFSCSYLPVLCVYPVLCLHSLKVKIQFTDPLRGQVPYVRLEIARGNTVVQYSNTVPVHRDL